MELSKNKKQSNRHILKWIFNRSKKFIPAILLMAFFSAVISIASVSLALVSKSIIDVATGDKSGSISYYAICIVAIIFIELFSNAMNSLLYGIINGRLTISLRNYLFTKISRKKYFDITKYHSGDLLNRLTSDGDVVISNVIGIIPDLTSMITKIITGITALVILDRKIAVLVLLLGMCVPAVGRLIYQKYKHLHKVCQETEGKSRSFLQECFENIVVIKAFVSQVPFTKKLNEYMHKNYQAKMKRIGLSIFSHLSIFSLFTFGYYAVLIWGASQISNQLITYGTLTAFLQLVSQLRGPMQNISATVPKYYSAIASAERLMELEYGEVDKPSVDSETLSEITNTFEFLNVKNIYFGYNDEIILKNCSFNIEKGKITAITGESGSGKSTIFKILLGLYEPMSGEILINDNIRLDTSHRALFSYVPQGNLVLSGTIRENISLCNDSISDEEIIKAAKAAEIYDIIENTPEGLNTVLSERGAGLSEGQIQRISIARALLNDAPILLLDEATSALDEETETRLLSNIKAMKNKTVLFVTHRNTSLGVCDKIIRVENKNFKVIKE